MQDAIIVLCTCPDKSVGEQIARILIEKQLAACVNMIPNIQSFYQWKGELVADLEVQLLIKTSAHLFSNIQEMILQNHPYELPEIVAVRLVEGYAPYLEWVAQNVQPA